MDVFFNELSFRPLGSSDEMGQDHLITLLQTIKSLHLKEKSFGRMRIPVGFFANELAPEYTVNHFLADNRIRTDIRTALLTVARKPYDYFGEDEADESERFVSSAFRTLNHLDGEESPEGIAAAYLFRSPSISLGSHDHWKRILFQLTRTPDEGDESTVSVCNLSSPGSIAHPSFESWLKQESKQIPLNSADNISQRFPDFIFQPRAIQDIITWYKEHPDQTKHISMLLEDIPQHPFVGGIGKTEPLKGNLAGRCSKRITRGDRIVYSYESPTRIIIHSCKGHYED